MSKPEIIETFFEGVAFIFFAAALIGFIVVMAAAMGPI